LLLAFVRSLEAPFAEYVLEVDADWLAKKLIVVQKLGYCGVIHNLGGFREVALRFDFVFLWRFIGLSAGERSACFSLRLQLWCALEVMLICRESSFCSSKVE
jgi:hypothetical protein